MISGVAWLDSAAGNGEGKRKRGEGEELKPRMGRNFAGGTERRPGDLAVLAIVVAAAKMATDAFLTSGSAVVQPWKCKLDEHNADSWEAKRPA
jgi:hypothetical protein